MKDKELNISNVWGKIPIHEIKQEDCEACVFGHYAILCGESGHFAGKQKCLEMLRERHNGANLAHLLVILRRCGADKDPWGGTEWKNYAETFKKLETAFENELPSLRGIDLSWANLFGANLYNTNFRMANLRMASLWRTNLRNTNLSGANLYDANLHNANLREANLSGADLRGAYLRNANLREANLSGTDLRMTDLIGANYNERTILPEGFDPEEEGMVREYESKRTY